MKRPTVPGEVWIHIDGPGLSRSDGRCWAVQALGRYHVVQRVEVYGMCRTQFDGPQSDHPRAYLVVKGTVDVDADATMAIVTEVISGETKNAQVRKRVRRRRSQR